MSSRSLLPVASLLIMFSCFACGSRASDTPSVTGDDARYTSGKVLLDCNVFAVGGGPDQQATVIEKNGALVLRELTNSGSTEERALDREEWDKQDIQLRHGRYDSPRANNHLWKEDGDWLNESKDDGFSVFGYADCFTDKSE